MTTPPLALQNFILRIVGRCDGATPGAIINQAVREGHSAESVRNALDWLLSGGQIDFHIERHGLVYRLPEGGVAHG